MGNSEFFRGFCFGLGQSVAGIIIIGIFGERICKYIVDIMKDIDNKKNSTDKTDLTMLTIESPQSIKSTQTTQIESMKNCEESLLSDGETVQIKPKITLKKL